jgi:hypothetical protein
VSSVGTPRKESLPGTLSPEKHTCYFRHALAADEVRVKFLPEYAHGGVMKPQGQTHQAEEGPPVPDKHRVKEVWFRGTHGDM